MRGATVNSLRLGVQTVSPSPLHATATSCWILFVCPRIWNPDRYRALAIHVHSVVFRCTRVLISSPLERPLLEGTLTEPVPSDFALANCC
jgi:hypothetical protein